MLAARANHFQLPCQPLVLPAAAVARGFGNRSSALISCLIAPSQVSHPKPGSQLAPAVRKLRDEGYKPQGLAVAHPPSVEHASGVQPVPGGIGGCAAS
jgi:hypothetical protein